MGGVRIENVPRDGLHNRRDRARSFGSVAENYDHDRPGYPSALIDELVTGNPSNALDVGCGTGKVAVSLMERGLSVLGIEPDDRMTSVARRHGVPVEPVSLESWEPAGRTYDLLTAGHSWHRVDPAVGLLKAASIMMPGGTAALFWNYHVLEESLLLAFDNAYRSHAPELTVIGRDPSGSEDIDPFRGSDDFVSLGSRSYRWPRLLNAEEWTSMLATFSDHAALGESRLKDLQGALQEAIQDSGATCGRRRGLGILHSKRDRSSPDPAARLALTGGGITQLEPRSLRQTSQVLKGVKLRG